MHICYLNNNLESIYNQNLLHVLFYEIHRLFYSPNQFELDVTFDDELQTVFEELLVSISVSELEALFVATSTS